jgi:hypothetical protein
VWEYLVVNLLKHEKEFSRFMKAANFSESLLYEQCPSASYEESIVLFATDFSWMHRVRLKG